MRGVSCVLALLLALGLSACGSGRSDRTGAATVVQVRERDFHIVVQPRRFHAGKVDLVVRNAGPDDHELIVVRARRWGLPLRRDDLTVNEERLEPRTVGALEPGAPGAVRTLRLDLAPGVYEVFCNMAGHYLGGMHAAFVVT